MRWIAIPFELNEGWLGGSYYIRNLISAMALLPADKQPFILLVSESQESIRFIQESGYSHLGWVTDSQFRELVGVGAVDVVFPHPIREQEDRTISWIPDFQELHLGYFFSDDEIARRRDHHRRRFATAGLIVSSQDVRNDVDRFYPGECNRIAVVRFASFDSFDPGKVDETRAKYGLPDRYIFCANQVWLHKNHILVLRAVALLKSMGVDVSMVFTGNEVDYRVAGYAAYLKQQAREWDILDRVHFLGFIPRGEQLCLMKGARYIVQPSLFEGWSTVIEDAKSMGQFVVASDLEVHKEQLTEACRFFSRHDPLALAEVIQELEGLENLAMRTTDYMTARRLFARDFMDAVEQFLPQPPSADAVKALALIREKSSFNLANCSGDARVAKPTPPAKQPQVSKWALEMPKPSHTKLKIKLDIQGKSYRALMIFTDKPIMLNTRYEKFLLKVVQFNRDLFIELRSGSITPAIILEGNAHGQDSYGHFMRIQLTPDEGEHRMKGNADRLPEQVQEDINTVLQAGLDRLREDAGGDTARVPDFLLPAVGGIRIGGAL